LDIDARADREYENSHGADKKGAVCFEVPSNYEITYENKKLVGSAQARRKEGILQHGTLPLYGDITRILQVLNLSDNGKRQRARENLLNRATTIETILGKVITWDAAAEAFEIAFQSVLNFELADEEISDWELLETERFIREKFGNDTWTVRV
jgi:lipoate-protein ligase A